MQRKALQALLNYLPPFRDWKYVIGLGYGFIGGTTALILLLKLLGIEDTINIDLFGVKTAISSWAWLIIWIIWVDANLYVRRHQKGESHSSYTFVSILLAFMAIVATIFHELGHLLVSLSFNNPISSAGFVWWGAFVVPSRNILTTAPIEEIAISLAGPGTNILLFLLALIFVRAKKESLSENSAQYFAVINYRFAILNMIPCILDLDGGKVMHGIIRMLRITEPWAIPIAGVSGIFILLFYLLYLSSTPKRTGVEKWIAGI